MTDTPTKTIINDTECEIEVDSGDGEATYERVWKTGTIHIEPKYDDWGFGINLKEKIIKGSDIEKRLEESLGRTSAILLGNQVVQPKTEEEKQLIQKIKILHMHFRYILTGGKQD